MKTLLEIVCLTAVLTASAAFDSAAWLERRAILSQEAERLRAAYSNCVAQVTEPAEEVVIPLETFPDGSIKTSVSARKARLFLEKDLVWAENVLVRKVDEHGETVAQIDARNCVIDRLTKSGWVNGSARIRTGKTVFFGEGVYFSSPEGFVTVTHRSKIVSEDLTFGGVR